MTKGWTLDVRFATKSGARQYVSNDVRRHNPGWGDERFRDPIEALKFHLPTGHTIVLSGMEAYVFYVEASSGLMGGGAKIEGFWICGKMPGSDDVEMYRISQGQVTRQVGVYGKEWRNGPVGGWRKGVPSIKPLSTIIYGG